MNEYIKREDAVNAIRDKFFTMSICVSADECKGMKYAQDLCAKTVEHCPSADVAPVVHGRLIKPNPFGNCSVCGFLIDIRDDFNYCPNCGAKMDL